MTEINSCELISTCEFFTHEIKSKVIAEQFKQKYCYGCKDACARYMIARAAGLDSIPTILYPNEYDKAMDIIYPSKE